MKNQVNGTGSDEPMVLFFIYKYAILNGTVILPNERLK